MDGEKQMSALRMNAIVCWKVLLDDKSALFESPGAHHKLLLKAANILHQSQIIDPHDLSDMLELADGALAYAIEASLDCSSAV